MANNHSPRDLSRETTTPIPAEQLLDCCVADFQEMQRLLAVVTDLERSLAHWIAEAKRRHDEMRRLMVVGAGGWAAFCVLAAWVGLHQ